MVSPYAKIEYRMIENSIRQILVNVSFYEVYRILVNSVKKS